MSGDPDREDRQKAWNVAARLSRESFEPQDAKSRVRRDSSGLSSPCL
jgi:hypothetical protein